MGFSEVRHKGSAVVIQLVTTDIASGHVPLIAKTLGEGPKVQHQVIDQITVLLGEALEHGRLPGRMSTILQVFFRLP
jgi:hypothetical protein